MNDNSNKIYEGVIIEYDGQLGIIEYFDHEIFFENSGLEPNIEFQKGNIVSFQIIESEKAEKYWQASKITLKHPNKTTGGFEVLSKLKFGTIIEYLNDNGAQEFGKIKHHDQITPYQFHYSYFIEDERDWRCRPGDKCIFISYFWPIIYFRNGVKQIEDKLYAHLFPISDSLLKRLDILTDSKNRFIEVVIDEILLLIKSRSSLVDYETVHKNTIELVSLYDLLRLLKTEIHQSAMDEFTKKVQEILSLRDRIYSGQFDVLLSFLKYLKCETADIIDIIHSKLDEKDRFELWLSGRSTNIPIPWTSIKESICNPPRLMKDNVDYERITNKITANLLHNEKHEVVLNTLLQEFTVINWDDYDFIKRISKLDYVSPKVKESFYKSAYIKCISTSKRKMITDGYIEINTKNIVDLYNSDDFIHLVSWFKANENILCEIEKFYSELPTKFQVQLWLFDILGDLDYTKFTQVFHQLTNNDKKLFNKKIKS